MRIVVKSLDKILANGIIKHINRTIYYGQEYNNLFQECKVVIKFGNQSM